MFRVFSTSITVRFSNFQLNYWEFSDITSNFYIFVHWWLSKNVFAKFSTSPENKMRCEQQKNLNGLWILNNKCKNILEYIDKTRIMMVRVETIMEDLANVKFRIVYAVAKQKMAVEWCGWPKNGWNQWLDSVLPPSPFGRNGKEEEARETKKDCEKKLKLSSTATLYISRYPFILHLTFFLKVYSRDKQPLITYAGTSFLSPSVSCVPVFDEEWPLTSAFSFYFFFVFLSLAQSLTFSPFFSFISL